MSTHAGDPRRPGPHVHLRQPVATRFGEPSRERDDRNRAATDSSRVLRIAGFYHHKYAELYQITVEHLSDEIYRPEHYARHTVPKAAAAFRQQAKRTDLNRKPALRFEISSRR